jgi:hypothetical protein
MKSITIHGIDTETEGLIAERSRATGKSVNKVVKELLAKALGLGRYKNDHRDEYDELFGIWKEDDEKQFLKGVKDLKEVHPKLWK